PSSIFPSSMVHAVPFRYIVTSTVLSAPTGPTTPKLGHVDSVTTCVLSFVQVSFPSAVKRMNLVLSIAAKNILTGSSAQCDFGVLAVPVQVHPPCTVSAGGALAAGGSPPGDGLGARRGSPWARAARRSRHRRLASRRACPPAWGDESAGPPAPAGTPGGLLALRSPAWNGRRSSRDVTHAPVKVTAIPTDPSLRAGPERAPWHELCVLDQHGCSCGTCYEARSTDVGRGRSPGADAVGLA